ncbi:2Fe-2S iron-sulfur cluster-binding protein [Pseudooceanicola marinus]|uniref:2Fe-2S iron-sulfur cluster-binding protein n=1 Tax=Pseudooceanicola marinus TaxID=396013 RepID=UPI0038CD2A74
MPRGEVKPCPYCTMAVCFDYLVTVDGQPNRQACMTGPGTAWWFNARRAPRLRSGPWHRRGRSRRHGRRSGGAAGDVVGKGQCGATCLGRECRRRAPPGA